MISDGSHSLRLWCSLLYQWRHQKGRRALREHAPAFRIGWVAAHLGWTSKCNGCLGQQQPLDHAYRLRSQLGTWALLWHLQNQNCPCTFHFHRKCGCRICPSLRPRLYHQMRRLFPMVLRGGFLVEEISGWIAIWTCLEKSRERGESGLTYD